MESKKKVEESDYVPIQIPTNQMFLVRWYAWTNKKVLSCYKRDRERALDSVQNVRLRLLSKDFIGRWFYKHLTNDLVDRVQAEKILDGYPIKFNSGITPVWGSRSDAGSLYRISDLLALSKFDYRSYFYSIQNHTIDSDLVLELLGYEPGHYSALQSMYRQGRLKPSEFTEHFCSGSACEDCERARIHLKEKKLSLAHDWLSPESRLQAKKLRWNDSQLRPYLRNWRSRNFIKCVPDYIMRPRGDIGIDAGLLKYAEKVIRNTVANDFKSFSRSDDLSMLVLDSRKNPEYADGELLAWDGDEDSENATRIIRDTSAHLEYAAFENKRDLNTLLERAPLTINERRVIQEVDFGEKSIREVASDMDLSAVRVNKIRQNAIEKMSDKSLPKEEYVRLAIEVATRRGIDLNLFLTDISYDSDASMELYARLYDLGYSIESIADTTGFYESAISTVIVDSINVA